MRASFVIVVHTLVFNAAGELLLLRRANTGFMDGHYALPGGHRQAGEEIVTAAIRECREEALIEVAEMKPAVVMPYDGGVDFIFEAIRFSGEPGIGEPDKCDDLLFAPTDALPSPTVDFVAAALECRAQGVWFREFH
ncbi:MAG: NUDIX domain-containing protein [Gammaproteobacteria bacterium]|nr:NUDIX domain-containing protein [Gammaproteobacteria bacterium]